MNEEAAGHWQGIYQIKSGADASWFQPVPQASMELIAASGVQLAAPIIDVGGGDSRLVDHLLDGGYGDVTVLDIAPAALDRARARLGQAAARVKWIAADITAFQPSRKYALWHDRAVFHFLVHPAERDRYLDTLTAALTPGAHLVLGTFGPQGPTRCSGLVIQRYSADDLTMVLGSGFRLRRHWLANHRTPRGIDQQFLWSWWQKQTSGETLPAA